jgi:hypothetical protein
MNTVPPLESLPKPACDKQKLSGSLGTESLGPWLTYRPAPPILISAEGKHLAAQLASID